MIKEVKSDIYHLLHPKITFFLTSVSKDGKSNVMACAWATPVSEEPPIIIVCVAKEHYTAELIKETKEFAISIPSKNMLKELWVAGRSSGRNSDKLKKAKLIPMKIEGLKVPAIEGCIGHIGCKLWKTVEAGECYAFFGNVLHAEVDEKYFKKGMWAKGAEIPLHLGGAKMVYF